MHRLDVPCRHRPDLDAVLHPQIPCQIAEHRLARPGASDTQMDSGPSGEQVRQCSDRPIVTIVPLEPPGRDDQGSCRRAGCRGDEEERVHAIQNDVEASARQP
jgi:hypothetical protein